MKHGPIALIDDGMPAVFIATRGSQYDKVMSNISEVRSRGGHVIAVATEGDREIDKHAEDVFFIPDVPECLSPMLAVVPLQLMAYHAAVLRGHDVDKPRNLAKSVTVEQTYHRRSSVRPTSFARATEGKHMERPQHTQAGSRSAPRPVEVFAHDTPGARIDTDRLILRPATRDDAEAFEAALDSLIASGDGTSGVNLPGEHAKQIVKRQLELTAKKRIRKYKKNK
eukprot:TRINITY_DN21059_c1_g1_i2.p1 TRINITY_DN21059_c1_g1~~TRINITY_DN21059_c1_g1_i2.p1  ORF type:complete len:225 (-),score=31.72 TRINITY_DN21059_c1_g1_i2:47-721(-)